MKRLVPVLFAALPFAPAAAGRDAPKPDRLDYRTPAGVTYVVTVDGLSEVRLGDRTLARGGWRFGVGDRRWGFPPGHDAAAVTEKSVDVVSPTEARVRHVHSHATVRHTFTFAGEDVRIESYVENRHPTAAIEVAAFTGPTVDFGRAPVGLLPNFHPTHTASAGVSFMHPGGIRIGGSYGVGDGFGVGAAPHAAGRFPTAILWDWDWQLLEKSPARTPTLFVHAPVPAGGARTFAVTFRFSPDTAWTHLLDPYRRHLHATLGDRTRYDRPTQLPLVQGVMNGTEAQRGPTNPYAYDANRRLDSIYGVTSYLAGIAPAMRAIRAQGLVIWGQGGLHPRGAMYRPDFDALPPDVVPNVVRLAEMLREQGMAFGLAARPGQVVQPLDWTTDTVTWLNVDRPEELELLTRRFNTAIGRGARLFYLDSFGNRADDVTILRAVRTGVGGQKGVGRDVQMYAEHPSDVILPYSGAMLGLNGRPDALGIFFAGNFWLSPPATPNIVEALRYFYPDAPVVALIATAEGTDTPDRQRAVVEYCYRVKMTPVIPDSWLGPGSKVPDWLPPLTRQYLTADGQWK
jgi:hypothetical protein